MTTVKDYVAPIIAAILIIFLMAVLSGLFGHLAMSQAEWDRAMYLLSGVEAVGFSAAGFLFGREVNRKRAEKAESREQSAEQKADTATKAAEAGRSLARAVKAKAATKSAAGAGTRYVAESAMAHAESDLSELSVMADDVLAPN